MNFYRFETKGQFQSVVSTSDTEFVKDGIQFSVIGVLPDGGFTPLLNKDIWESQQTPPEEQTGLPEDEVLAVGGEYKPDGTVYEKDEVIMQPTFKAGWHVNASDAVVGWEAMEVSPTQPSRIFG